MRVYTNVSCFGNKIYLREVQDGKRINHKIDSFHPVLYVERGPKHTVKVGPNTMRTIDGGYLMDYAFKGAREMREFKKKYEHVPNFNIHGDIYPHTQFISEEYGTEPEYDISQIKIANIDIEVYSKDGKFPYPEDAKYPINAITLKDSISGEYVTWGLEHDSQTYKNGMYKTDYRGFTSEKELLFDFIFYWSMDHPDIVTGWNILTFDIPYIINRCKLLLGEKVMKRLSPWNMVHEDTIRVFNKEIPTYSIKGVAILDYIIQYKKYSYTPQPSYKLDWIAYAELGDRKLSYDEAAGLHGLYINDYQKFIDYNIKDVDIVDRLDQKIGLMGLIISVAYYSQINFDEVVSPIRIWDSIIYNHLKQQNIVIPPNKRSEKSGKFAGAYVKIPEPGKYKWVCSVDLASLYPSLIRGINISTDTIMKYDELPEELLTSVIGNDIDDFVAKKPNLEDLKKYDVSMSSNEQFFRKDKKGFFPILLEKLYIERKANKKQMIEYKKQYEATHDEKYKQKAKIYDVMQNAKKVLLNSAYGAMGTEYFRYYDLKMAEAVTCSGQVAIQWIARKLNEYFNKVIGTKDVEYVFYIDTDSNYINMGPLVDKYLKDNSTEQIVNYLDKFFKLKVEPFMTESYKELYEYMNHYEQLMFMDREVIADVGIWSSKKRYMLRVHDNEGVRYEEPKTKIMGLSMIKSNVPERCRKVIQDAIPIFFDGINDNAIKVIEDFREEWNNLPPEEIAVTTSVSNITKYQSGKGGFIKGTPIGSKCAIIYNNLCKKYDLNSSGLIGEGDKMKYVYLKIPNPLGVEAIGFVDFLPKEFELESWIDKEKMFERAFLSPMKDVLDALEWKTEKVSTLESFFGV